MSIKATHDFPPPIQLFKATSHRTITYLVFDVGHGKLYPTVPGFIAGDSQILTSC